MQSKTIVMALALILAQPVIANDNCDIFADVMYRIATERDSGVSRREMRQRVILQVDKKLQKAFLALVDMAYEEPRLTPDSEANNLYKECMKASGTKTGVSF